MSPPVLALLYHSNVLCLFLGFFTILQNFGQILNSPAIYFILHATFQFGKKKNLVETI